MMAESLAKQRSTLRDIAIVGTHNTRQARRLDGETSVSVTADAIIGALADAGIDAAEVDGIVANVMDPMIVSSFFIPLLGGQPSWIGSFLTGISAVLEAASAIAAGLCNVAVVAAGQAGAYQDRSATAPWTQSASRFMAPFGVYTAVEYALVARRHMHLYGTTREQMAEVAATIRNNGHLNPEAVYYGRGPFTPRDILESRPICDPFNLLDCSMTSEGGSAIVLVHRDRLTDLDADPVFILGGGTDNTAQGYTRPPVWDQIGLLGRRAAQRCFAMSGLAPRDVDVCEFYDAFSWEIIRQFEAYGFCAEGEGGPFMMDGRIGLKGEYPIVTDGGTMSHSHPGAAQMLQKVISGVRQIQGRAGNRQIPGARVAMASNAGSGSLVNDVVLLGREAVR